MGCLEGNIILNGILIHLKVNYIFRNYTGQKSHDLAVLIVDQPFPINDFIRPACLPALGWAGNIKGGNMVISGMGKTPTSSAQSPNMKIATIPMKSKSECKQNPNIGSAFRGIPSVS